MLISALTLFSQELKIRNKTKLFVGPSVDITPLTFETGAIGGFSVNNKWFVGYQYLYSFPHDYNYQAIDISRMFDAGYDDRLVGFGIKAGIYDGYYLNFRPFLRVTYIFDDSIMLQIDMTARTLAPDISLQLIFYIW